MNWQLTEKMSTISISIAGFHSKLFQLRFETQKNILYSTNEMS